MADERRPEQSGRYGLFEEAVEWMGRCATKRILAVDSRSAMDLLAHGRLGAGEWGAAKDSPVRSSRWWDKWSKHDALQVGLRNVSPGAVIVVCPVSVEQDASSLSTIYLACSYKDGVVRLMTERRIADAWLRLLRATIPESGEEVSEADS